MVLTHSNTSETNNFKTFIIIFKNVCLIYVSYKSFSDRV
eukprot:UN08427